MKLWSCVECFFTITEEKITEASAKGIASILVFGGYRVVEPSQYVDTKRRVKKLYQLRSKALHRAQFGHIETSDLDQLSSWVAWVIVTMVSLSERGYTTLEQVKEQVLRLDDTGDRCHVRKGFANGGEPTVETGTFDFRLCRLPEAALVVVAFELELFDESGWTCTAQNVGFTADDPLANTPMHSRYGSRLCMFLS